MWICELLKSCVAGWPGDLDPGGLLNTMQKFTGIGIIDFLKNTFILKVKLLVRLVIYILFFWKKILVVVCFFC